MFLIAPESVEKIKCSVCSYENNLVLTFTSILKNNGIQKEFCDFLRKKGIEVKIEGNGVNDAIS